MLKEVTPGMLLPAHHPLGMSAMERCIRRVGPVVRMIHVPHDLGASPCQGRSGGTRPDLQRCRGDVERPRVARRTRRRCSCYAVEPQRAMGRPVRLSGRSQPACRRGHRVRQQRSAGKRGGMSRKPYDDLPCWCQLLCPWFGRSGGSRSKTSMPSWPRPGKWPGRPVSW
jgi:hypothetical protein